MNDWFKSLVGVAGTTASITLSEWSLIASIAAGFATAIWMACQVAHRVRDIIAHRKAKNPNEKKDPSETN